MRLEYFTAKWCGPCKFYGPIVNDVTTKLDVPIEKIDIDEEWSRVPSDVRGVPTIIMYNDDKEVSRIVGARSEDDLRGWISSGGI